MSLDLTGIIVEVNPQWEHLSGYIAAEMIGHNYLELVPEDRLAIFYANFERLAAEGELVGQDCYLRHEDGSVRDVLMFGRIDADHERANCILVDGTDFHVSKSELVESEERFRTLFPLAPTPIVIHDGQTIVMANQACAKFLGYDSPDELRRIPVTTLVLPEDRAIVAERVKRLMTED